MSTVTEDNWWHEGHQMEIGFEGTPAGKKLDEYRLAASKYWVEIWLNEIFDKIANPFTFFGANGEVDLHQIIREYASEVVACCDNLDHMREWMDNSTMRRIKSRYQTFFSRSLCDALAFK